MIQSTPLEHIRGLIMMVIAALGLLALTISIVQPIAQRGVGYRVHTDEVFR